MAQKLYGPADELVDERDYSKVEFIYNFFPNIASACRHYRVEVPLSSFGKLGLAEAALDSIGKDESSMHMVCGSDVVLLYALGGMAIERLVEKVRNEYATKLKEKFPKYVPPAFIYDIDDNIDWTHPLNPAFVNLGTRDTEGKPLDEGDIVWIIDGNGVKKPLWVDRVTHMQTSNGEHEVFDVYRNQKFNASCHRVMAAADGITVSCKYLADYFHNERGVQKPYVFPNSVIPEQYPQIEFKEREKEVKMLWQGGASHATDLYPVRDALIELTKKYPQLKIVMWGMEYRWILDHLPKEQCEYVAWVGYDTYPTKRATLDCDINIAPLTEDIFSMSKTPIKWYEASVLAQPEATLAAKVGPYAEEIKDGETGFLYSTVKEFVDKASALIENKELRKETGKNAKKWVIENRKYDKTVPGLYEYYKEVRMRQVLSAGV
jgi:glycosyltransferase involved in cell wall biosynthesis